ncbi:serine/threonine-protein kinase [Kribbella sp. VKM Ac-2571]|uniref:serine/threonine-protein kinase n=1 Tax=Kribbella sp. VKM Ac-2571 TaxID=2512222 RepID=UPI001414CF02|nr:protein kinase [Kribbella sp. VKM Ac-2571]
MTDKAGPDSAPALPGCTDVVLVRSGIPKVYRCLWQGTAASALVYPVHVDASTAAMFNKQAKALQGVNHSHVASVLESGVADGFPYLISTADAGTLAEQVRSQLHSPADLAVLGRQLAEGLAALHGAGLIHGGLTPGAVVLLSDGRPQLSALTLGLGQHTGHAALNSPSQLYVAPETLRDGTLTASSDLYALGAVLHAAISGKPPLAARMGETAGEHILRVLNEPPARLDVLPDEFAEVIARLLEKDPAKRPVSAEVVAAALAALGTPTTPPIPPVRPVAAAPKQTAPAKPPLPRPAVMSRATLRSWPTPDPQHKPAPQQQTTPAAPPAPQQPTPAPPTQSALPPHAGAPGPSAAGHPPTATPPPGQPPSGQSPAGSASSPAAAGPKRRNWLLAAASVVVAAAVITTFALVNRKGQTATPPLSAPTPTTASTPALAVKLNPPADHSTYVDLSWSGPSDVNYAVVIAQVGQPADVKLVYKHTKYRVNVVPGIQYCFAVQATDGINKMETDPRPVRDAQCER